MSKRHALVIGAGPAGSVAALLLVRGGWHVRIVEQQRFPRNKVCGECLSALGMDVLERAGLAGPLRGAGAVELRRTMLIDRAGHAADIQLPRPMWGISRARLDTLLLDAAVNAGAELMQPARCEAIEPGAAGQRPSARIRHLPSNRVETLPAQVILLADGRGSLLPAHRGTHRRMGLGAHFADIDLPADAITLFGVDGHYGGLAPVEDGRWNMAFAIPRQRMADTPDLDRLFARIIHENRGLARALHSARRVSVWRASPLPEHGLRRRWPAGVIPIGTAAAAVEPLGGEGMGLALASAELAAAALLTGNTKQLRDDLQHLWRTRRWSAQIAAQILSSPSVCWCLTAALPRARPLVRPILRMLGK